MHTAPTLLLFPTEGERRMFFEAGALGAQDRTIDALCGFGPVLAAARAATWIERVRPGRVLLVGIAGTYDGARHPPGSSVEFGSVFLHGVGAGEGDDLRTPSDMGFASWPGTGPAGPQADDPEAAGAPSAPDAIGDRLELAGDGPLLVTVCAASDGPDQAERRRRWTSDRGLEGAAEDMEAFAVAAACSLEKIPLHVVRGLSNVAGDRNRENWCVAEALVDARGHVERILGTGASAPG